MRVYVLERYASDRWKPVVSAIKRSLVVAHMRGLISGGAFVQGELRVRVYVPESSGG